MNQEKKEKACERRTDSNDIVTEWKSIGDNKCKEWCKQQREWMIEDAIQRTDNGHSAKSTFHIADDWFDENKQWETNEKKMKIVPRSKQNF